MVIPDGDGKQRTVNFSSKFFKTIVLLSIVLTVGIIGVLVYSIPRARNYDSLNADYQVLLQERVKVMNLAQDLERMKQMNEVIRQGLGVETSDLDGGDQVGFGGSQDLNISFLENIPSVMPIQGFITQKMITRAQTWKKNHYGIDIAVKEGEPVMAAASGQVIFSGWTYDLGNLIILYHGDGYFTHYGHNQLNLVEDNDYVKRSDVIAHTGNTGISSGPHLHFEVWKDGQAVDPLLYFPQYTEQDLSVDKNNG